MFFLLLVLGRAFPHMDASPCGATPPHALISGFFSTLIFTPVRVTVVSLTGQSMEITGSYLLVCVWGREGITYKGNERAPHAVPSGNVMSS